MCVFVYIHSVSVSFLSNREVELVVQRLVFLAKGTRATANFNCSIYFVASLHVKLLYALLRPCSSDLLYFSFSHSASWYLEPSGMQKFQGGWRMERNFQDVKYTKQ